MPLRAFRKLAAILYNAARTNFVFVKEEFMFFVVVNFEMPDNM